MRDMHLVFNLVRRRLWVFSGVLAACALAVWASYASANAVHGSLVLLQQQLQAQLVELEQKQTDLTNIQTHIDRYQLLRKQGLLGDPDRAAWVEQLQASHKKLELTTSLVYNLQAPVGMEPIMQGESSVTPWVHDLQFELTKVHEDDVLSLLRDYQAQVKGRFRVNNCKMVEPRDEGLTAQCVLRFVTLPLEATPSGAPGTGVPQ